MKYLLDTSIWLWSLALPEKINSRGRRLLTSGRDELYLSAASSWEISIKFALGTLRLPEPPAQYVPKRMADMGMRPLPITHTHALAVSDLPMHHSDPFDRLLIAQAKEEGMVILTADKALEPYDAEIVWCG
jgi:PIN domain nuclease of toxin-antitoxin system